MDTQVQRYPYNEVNLNRTWLERVILQFADLFEIRIVWDTETVLLTSTLAVAGGLLGGYTGGRLGAALGAGVGGAAGFGISKLVSLREIWITVKEKLKELFYIVLNFLRRLDPVDYKNAYNILMACTSSRRELALSIIEFIVEKLGREVLSTLTVA